MSASTYSRKVLRRGGLVEFPRAKSWPFVRGYLDAALWTSGDEDGEPLSSSFTVEDFGDVALRKAIDDCNAFMEMTGNGRQATDGRDFWLARNDHHELGKDFDEELFKVARTFRGCRAYPSDDGKIYFLER